MSIINQRTPKGSAKPIPQSANSRHGVEDGERGGAVIRFEPGADAEGKGALATEVSVDETPRDRVWKVSRIVGEDGVERERGAVLRRLAAGEAAEDEPAEVLEHAGELELGEEPVHAVGRLADLFEVEDRAGEVGQVRRPEERGEHGEVAAEEDALGLARPDGFEWLAAGAGDLDG